MIAFERGKAFRAGMLAAAEIAKNVQGCGGIGSVYHHIKVKAEER